MEFDTIAAIATAPGESGVGIVRVSGPEAIAMCASLAPTSPPLPEAKSHTVHHAWLRDAAGAVLDEALVTVMRGPRTFTGEDVVEIGVHGGAIPARRVLRAVLAAGARLADRGEFTKRAYVHGRLDLSQAEAVCDVIRARTERGADAALATLAGKLGARIVEIESSLLDLLARLEASLDFAEDVGAIDRAATEEALLHTRDALDELWQRVPWGRRLREGASVVIVGRPNVGKSSLFNALIADDRALVNAAPGTTRDYLDAWIDIEGMPVRLIDTAGLRDVEDDVESEGVRRSRQLQRAADVRIVVYDLSTEWSAEDEAVEAETSDGFRVVVGNKADVARGAGDEPGGARRARADLDVSARTGAGVSELRSRLGKVLLEGVGREPDDDVAPDERQGEAIRRARDSIGLTIRTWGDGGSEELVAGDLRDAVEALGGISGRTVGEEVLARIFTKFCVGK